MRQSVYWSRFKAAPPGSESAREAWAPPARCLFEALRRQAASYQPGTARAPLFPHGAGQGSLATERPSHMAKK